MNFNTFPGRNDNVHGDEHYYDYLGAVKEQTGDDVIKIIATGGSDSYDWIKLLQEGDIFYHLVIILCKGKDKPEYREMLKELKIEIEGWI
jgi:hypothetical protein